MKRLLPHFMALEFFLVLIPIFFCAMLYTCGSNLYIPHLNLSIPHSALCYGTLVWAFAWINCTPIRVICRKHILSEIAFYVFPVSIPALFVFAQYHFYIAASLAVIIAAAFVLIVVRLSLRRTFPAFFNILTRNFVSVCSAALVIPVFLAIFVYNMRSPTYSVSQQLLASLTEEQALRSSNTEEDIFHASEELLLQFAPKYWSEHSLEEKLNLVNGLVDFEGQRFGVPPVSVTAEALDDDILGHYSHSANMISVNAAFLDCADPRNIISAVAHECHHAFAAWVCENTDWDSPITNTILYDQVRAWDENGQNYISGALDYQAYAEQPLERDANLYAEEETARITACWPSENEF